MSMTSGASGDTGQGLLQGWWSSRTGSPTATYVWNNWSPELVMTVTASPSAGGSAPPEVANVPYNVPAKGPPSSAAATTAFAITLAPPKGAAWQGAGAGFTSPLVGTVSVPPSRPLTATGSPWSVSVPVQGGILGAACLVGDGPVVVFAVALAPSLPTLVPLGVSAYRSLATGVPFTIKSPDGTWVLASVGGSVVWAPTATASRADAQAWVTAVDGSLAPLSSAPTPPPWADQYVVAIRGTELKVPTSQSQPLYPAGALGPAAAQLAMVPRSFVRPTACWSLMPSSTQGAFALACADPTVSGCMPYILQVPGSAAGPSAASQLAAVSLMPSAGTSGVLASTVPMPTGPSATGTGSPYSAGGVGATTLYAAKDSPAVVLAPVAAGGSGSPPTLFPPAPSNTAAPLWPCTDVVAGTAGRPCVGVYNWLPVGAVVTVRGAQAGWGAALLPGGLGQPAWALAAPTLAAAASAMSGQCVALTPVGPADAKATGVPGVLSFEVQVTYGSYLPQGVSVAPATVTLVAGPASGASGGAGSGSATGPFSALTVTPLWYQVDHGTAPRSDVPAAVVVTWCDAAGGATNVLAAVMSPSTFYAAPYGSLGTRGLAPLQGFGTSWAAGQGTALVPNAVFTIGSPDGSLQLAVPASSGDSLAWQAAPGPGTIGDSLFSFRPAAQFGVTTMGTPGLALYGFSQQQGTWYMVCVQGHTGAVVGVSGVVNPATSGTVLVPVAWPSIGAPPGVVLPPPTDASRWPTLTASVSSTLAGGQYVSLWGGPGWPQLVLASPPPGSSSGTAAVAIVAAQGWSAVVADAPGGLVTPLLCAVAPAAPQPAMISALPAAAGVSLVAVSDLSPAAAAALAMHTTCLGPMTVGCPGGAGACTLWDTDAGQLQCGVLSNLNAAVGTPAFTAALAAIKNFLAEGGAPVCNQLYTSSEAGGCATVAGQVVTSCSGWKTGYWGPACTKACALAAAAAPSGGTTTPCDTYQADFCSANDPALPDCSCINVNTSPFPAASRLNMSYPDYRCHLAASALAPLQVDLEPAQCWWPSCDAMSGGLVPSALADASKRGATCPTTFNQCLTLLQNIDVSKASDVNIQQSCTGQMTPAALAALQQTCANPASHSTSSKYIVPQAPIVVPPVTPPSLPPSLNLQWLFSSSSNASGGSQDQASSWGPQPNAEASSNGPWAGVPVGDQAATIAICVLAVVLVLAGVGGILYAVWTNDPKQDKRL
jgi:hypothetical protein